nr:uncharacterized protein LOC119162222 [Rhipicephalus microplus]
MPLTSLIDLEIGSLAGTPDGVLEVAKRFYENLYAEPTPPSADFPFVKKRSAAAARRQLPLTVAATTRGLPLLTRASSASPSGASPTCPQRSARHQAAAEARRAGRRVAAAGVSRACCVKILLGRWCAREASGGARWCVDVPCDRCCNGPAIGGQAPLPAAGQLPGGGVSPVGSDDDQDEASAQDRAGPPGWSLFRGFVHENAQCFWNQCLVQSVACLEYRGYLIPSTIFVSGNEYTLEVVRSAWSRRVLRPPVGYEIQKLECVGHERLNRRCNLCGPNGYRSSLLV